MTMALQHSSMGRDINLIVAEVFVFITIFGTGRFRISRTSGERQS